MATDRSLRRGQIVAAIALLGLEIALALDWVQLPRFFSVYHDAPTEIETFLKTQTPLGSSREQVRAWLVANGATLNNEAAPDVKRDERIDAIIARYFTPFVVTVFGSYRFDRDGRLLTVVVTKGGDWP